MEQPEAENRGGGRDDGVTFDLSAIFHGSISKHFPGGSSLIPPEQGADSKGSLGSKKQTPGPGSTLSPTEGK